jgi:hypothetical protein
MSALRRPLQQALLCLSLALALGCSGGISLTHYNTVDQRLRQGRFLSIAEQSTQDAVEIYGPKNRLVYHLDMVMLNHLAGRFGTSNLHCARAEQLGEELFTRSLGAEVGSLFTSDLDITYRGEDSERVMVHLMGALNWAIIGDPMEALVEIRKVNYRLRELREGYGDGSYREDPLAGYLGALLYTEMGEYSDAVVSARQALAAYGDSKTSFGVRTPYGLELLASELGAATGDSELFGRPLPPPPPPANFNEGEVVVVHLVGPGPRKKERIFQISVGDGMVFVHQAEMNTQDQKDSQRALSGATGMVAGTQVVVAYPVFHQPPEAAQGALVSLRGCGGPVEEELVENVSAIAKANLEDRVARDRARMIARAVLKFLAAQTAGAVGEQASGEKWVGLLTRLVTQAAMSATEAADTRSWRTLPSKIYLSRFRCPTGVYELELKLLGTNGYRGFTSAEVFTPDESFSGPEVRGDGAAYAWIDEGGRVLVPRVRVEPGHRTWLSVGTW